METSPNDSFDAKSFIKILSHNSRLNSDDFEFTPGSNSYRGRSFNVGFISGIDHFVIEFSGEGEDIISRELTDAISSEVGYKPNFEYRIRREENFHRKRKDLVYEWDRCDPLERREQLEGSENILCLKVQM